ncbi:MAG TPA: chemotaxis response regulator protein-glutamate methylesterase [Oscillospiraceae bacterium]|nr:chemotaxis response regulator protein-glutamate methylesterase [Oscillospiraceae bacterium]
MAKKIKVLIVDDSAVSREVMNRGISLDPYIEVVATAADPFEARDKILKYKPDVMICDIEMPKMNGIEFVRQLLPQYPIPVIMVTAVSEAVFDAINAGAVDFVTKPNTQSSQNIKGFIMELTEKIKIANNSNISEAKANILSSVVSTGQKHINTRQIIAIGASTGGTEAIYNLLKSLPVNVPGIVITQHIPPVFSNMFAERLNNFTHFTVKEAETGDYVEQGKVLVAPGDQHMKIRRVGNRYKVICFEGERVSGHCPSVDVLFESVAEEAGECAVGIILTGMGCDGAKGLFSMREKGARTIGQDEKSSVIYGMPRAAFNIGAVEKQLSLVDIPKMLCALCSSQVCKSD